MNQIRLLRLNREDREKYVREELEKMKINELKHVAREYGVRNTKEMSKPELIDTITDALCRWAEERVSAVHMLFVLE